MYCYFSWLIPARILPFLQIFRLAYSPACVFSLFLTVSLPTCWPSCLKPTVPTYYHSFSSIISFSSHLPPRTRSVCAAAGSAQSRVVLVLWERMYKCTHLFYAWGDSSRSTKTRQTYQSRLWWHFHPVPRRKRSAAAHIPNNSQYFEGL